VRSAISTEVLRPENRSVVRLLFWVTNFVCNEIRRKNHFIVYREKGSKLVGFKEEKWKIRFKIRPRFFQGTTEVSCYKYLHWKRKQKYHITLICEENKLNHVLPNSSENGFSFGLC
jgi:hypothetical protein